MHRTSNAADVGSSPTSPTKLQHRFFSKVDTSAGHGPNGDCHIWTAGTDGKGYGAFWLDGKMHKAQRIAMFVATGVMPELCVLHRCDNRLCVRIEHLFTGTKSDNSNDALKKGRLRYSLKKAQDACRNKTHCVAGHLYTPENTYINKSGYRSCNTCRQMRSDARKRVVHIQMEQDGQKGPALPRFNSWQEE